MKNRGSQFLDTSLSPLLNTLHLFLIFPEREVIVLFTITFRELDSDELLIFTDTADKGRIADLKVTSVSLLVAGGESFPMVLIDLVLFAPEHSYQYNFSPK